MYLQTSHAAGFIITLGVRLLNAHDMTMIRFLGSGGGGGGGEVMERNHHTPCR